MKLALFAAAALSLTAALPASAASFLGDTVDGVYYFPDSSTVYQDDGTAVVSPFASFFFDTGYPNVTATVTGGQIALTFDAGGGSYTPASFNGVVITDLTNSDITSATLDSSSTLAGFTSSDISFTGDSVSLNLQGLSVPDASDTVVIDVFGSAAPEPSTWLLMIAGIGGIGLMFRRAKVSLGLRFKNATSA